MEDEHRHHQRRRHGDEEVTTVAQPGAADRHRGNEDQRPHEIPLLLDGQRPEMAQQRRVGRGEIRCPAQDLAPVADVENRPRQVPLQCRLLFWRAEQRSPDRHRDEHREHGRQQSPSPAQPELFETDPLLLLALVEQERGDQVAGDDEEHLDSEETARHPPEAAVIEHHCHDADRAEPVEARLVTHPPRPGGRDVDDVVGPDPPLVELSEAPQRWRISRLDRRCHAVRVQFNTASPSPHSAAATMYGVGIPA